MLKRLCADAHPCKSIKVERLFYSYPHSVACAAEGLSSINQAAAWRTWTARSSIESIRAL